MIKQMKRKVMKKVMKKKMMQQQMKIIESTTDETHTAGDMINTFADIEDTSRNFNNCAKVVAALNLDANKVPVSGAWEVSGDDTSRPVACNEPPGALMVEEAGGNGKTLFDLGSFLTRHGGDTYNRAVRHIKNKCCGKLAQCHPMPKCIKGLLDDDEKFRDILGCGIWDSKECDKIQKIVENDFETLESKSKVSKKIQRHQGRIRSV